MSAKSHQEKFGGQKDSPKPSQPCGQILPTLRELAKKEGCDVGARACHCRSKGMDWKNYALTAFLVAAVGLMDAIISLANRTPSFTCSFGISLPWCNTPKESAQTRILLNIVRASRSLPLEDSAAGGIFQQGMLTRLARLVTMLDFCFGLVERVSLTASFRACNPSVMV